MTHTDANAPLVLIVGAGMAGLTAASQLIRRGCAVTLLDKGRSVGGRMATRRLGGGLADHGAQFFTVRSREFESAITFWREAEWIYRWSLGFSDGNRARSDVDGHARYAALGGMNALARHLAATLGTADIVLNATVEAVYLTDDRWHIVTNVGAEFPGDALLLTAPVPQSLALHGHLRTALAPTDRQTLEHIAYDPCLCGLFQIEGEVLLPEPGALQRPAHDFPWIADNQAKGISSGGRVITVHASGAFSRALWEAAEDDALAALEAELRQHLPSNARIVEKQLKRWRYAQPIALHSERFLLAQNLPPLAFAGDAFGEARIEGAYLSGLAAGRALADSLGL